MKKTLLALSILSAFSGGWAQGAEPLFFEMDEFIVVGHKIKKEDPHASINIEEKIDAGQLHTAADILENVPGMVVSRGQNSGIQVGMRGLNHERTVIAINGNVVDNIGEIMRDGRWNGMHSRLQISSKCRSSAAGVPPCTAVPLPV